MKTRVSKVSGLSDDRSFWVKFSILNYPSVEELFGGGLRKTLETTRVIRGILFPKAEWVPPHVPPFRFNKYTANIF